MRQMLMREDLEKFLEEENFEGLEKLKKETTGEQVEILDEFESTFNAGDLSIAKSLYNQLQFLFKLLEEINKAEEKLLDY